MAGIRPVFEKGSPLTYSANVLIKGGQLVEPDGTTGRVKPTAGVSAVCLGVATGDASAYGYSNANTTDSWGNPVVNAQYPPNEVAVASHGVWRLTATGTAGEVQTLTEGGSLTAFTLTFSGQTTASLVAASTAAEVQSALESLSNINPGDVTVTGSTSGPYTVRFGGQFAGVNVPALTSTPTGGTVTVATTQEGDASGISFGALVVSAASGLVQTVASNTFDKVIGRCVEPKGIHPGTAGKILLGGVGG